MPERCCAPQRGQTPLHQAAHHGRVAVVEQLLAAGAAVDVKNNVSGKRDPISALGAEHSFSLRLVPLALCVLLRSFLAI